MEFVHQAMADGGQDDSRDAEKQQPAEQGVATGKEFSSTRLQRCERAHAGKDHCRVREGIQPVKVFEKVITRHADAQGHREQTSSDQKTLTQSPIKRLAGQQRAGAMFKHRDILFRHCNYSSATSPSGGIELAQNFAQCE